VSLPRPRSPGSALPGVRGWLNPSGCITATGSSGRHTPGWRRAVVGGFCLILWKTSSVKHGLGLGGGDSQHPELLPGRSSLRQPRTARAVPPLSASTRLGGQSPRLAGLARAAARSQGCSASDACFGASSVFLWI